MDAMLGSAERGGKLDYNLRLLPVARLAYSVVLNWCGKVGPIPEGMSVATALRVQRLKSNRAAIKARLLEKVEWFKTERSYVPPYWELVRLAREAQTQQGSANILFCGGPCTSTQFYERSLHQNSPQFFVRGHRAFRLVGGFEW